MKDLFLFLSFGSFVFEKQDNDGNGIFETLVGGENFWEP